MSYLYHLVVLFEIYAVVASSLNLLIGYGGLLQVAHAAYFGIGAYVYALTVPRLGLAALLLGPVVAVVASLLVSLPAWRFRGDTFVMISLAAQLAIWAVMYNWVAVTRGPFGISGIPRLGIGGARIDTPGAAAISYGVMVLLVIGLLGILKRSPFGRALQATRDDELAARSLGLPVRSLKLQAFAVASASVAFAGGIYASYVTYIDPTSFSLDESILVLSMVIVGGTGNLVGPLVGALTLIAIPEALRLADVPSTAAANLRLMAYGLLLVGLMYLRPQGIAGRYRFE